VDNGIDLLSVSSSWMDVFEVFASGMTGSRWWGGLNQGLLQLLVLYGHRKFVSCLTTLCIAVKKPARRFP
jgi:hypothetical protein